jgi:alkanesulfonate monooxygenase
MPAVFGVAVRNFVGPEEQPDIDAILRYAKRAEELGYESLWAWDHIILGVRPFFPILDCLVTLTTLAAHTERIRLGTGILVLPLRNPVVLAKELSSLDQVSKGRLMLGLAAGWYAREFDAVGVPFRGRGRIFERNLSIMLRLWTEDRVTLKVDEFNLRDAVMEPKPYQKPRPPVLIGGYAEAVLRRVARMGDGWITYFYTADSFKRNWDKIVHYAEELGRDPSTLSSTNQLAIYVGRSRGEVEPPMRQWLSTEWDTASWSESTIEHAIMGSPQECADQLAVHLQTGIDRIILIPYRYQLEQLEIIAAEVLPKLR